MTMTHPFDAGMTAGTRLAERILNYQTKNDADNLQATASDAILNATLLSEEEDRTNWLAGLSCGIDNVVLHWRDPKIPAEPEPLLCEICDAELVVADGYYIVESLESENSLCFCTVRHMKEWCDRQ